jgi:hypothetical protein
MEYKYARRKIGNPIYDFNMQNYETLHSFKRNLGEGVGEGGRNDPNIVCTYE